MQRLDFDIYAEIMRRIAEATKDGVPVSGKVIADCSDLPIDEDMLFRMLRKGRREKAFTFRVSSDCSGLRVRSKTLPHYNKVLEVRIKGLGRRQLTELKSIIEEKLL